MYFTFNYISLCRVCPVRIKSPQNAQQNTKWSLIYDLLSFINIYVLFVLSLLFYVFIHWDVCLYYFHWMGYMNVWIIFVFWILFIVLTILPPFKKSGHKYSFKLFELLFRVFIVLYKCYQNGEHVCGHVYGLWSKKMRLLWQRVKACRYGITSGSTFSVNIPYTLANAKPQCILNMCFREREGLFQFKDISNSTRQNMECTCGSLNKMMWGWEIKECYVKALEHNHNIITCCHIIHWSLRSTEWSVWPIACDGKHWDKKSFKCMRRDYGTRIRELYSLKCNKFINKLLISYCNFRKDRFRHTVLQLIQWSSFHFIFWFFDLCFSLFYL